MRSWLNNKYLFILYNERTFDKTKPVGERSIPQSKINWVPISNQIRESHTNKFVSGEYQQSVSLFGDYGSGNEKPLFRIQAGRSVAKVTKPSFLVEISLEMDLNLEVH
jgi:hypothetical protein